MPFASPRPLGDQQLDAEHERFEQLATSLLQAMPQRMASCLESLRQHAAAHFEAEDEDLRRLGGHNARCHLDEHAAVLQSLEQVQAVLADATTPAEAKALLVRRLATQLLQWLPDHVDQMDAGVAAARERTRLGGTRVQLTRKSVPSTG